MFYSTHLEKFYASQSRSKKKEQPTSNLNIMIVGKCGAGKTTFVRSLCRRLEGVILQGTLKVSKPWMLDNARPTDEVYHVSMHLENKLAGGGCIALTIIDTPGFVQDPTIMDHQVQYFSKYIDHQFAKTLNEETKIRRDRTKAILDSHVHACLYFLDSSRWMASTSDASDLVIDEDDCRILKILCSRTNVIPVIGKAHTSIPTREFKEKCRTEIFNQLQIPVYGYLDIDQDDTVVDDATAGESATEHSLIRSDTLDSIVETLQEYVEEQEDEQDDAFKMLEYLANMPYVFGLQSKVENEEEDLAKFVDMLITDHRGLLRIDTYEQFYEQYRTEQLLNSIADKLADEPPGINARIFNQTV